jgi:hypothetical protein
LTIKLPKSFKITENILVGHVQSIFTLFFKRKNSAG